MAVSFTKRKKSNKLYFYKVVLRITSYFYSRSHVGRDGLDGEVNGVDPPVRIRCTLVGNLLKSDLLTYSVPGLVGAASSGIPWASGVEVNGHPLN